MRPPNVALQALHSLAWATQWCFGLHVGLRDDPSSTV